MFRNEAGGHRWQRIPPTEKRGRVHTSTVTVAVLPEESLETMEIRERDLIWRTTRGSGPGGQHRNKTDSCVILTHRPTGISVRCEAERSQQRNRDLALRLVRHKLYEAEAHSRAERRNAQRSSQIGSGMRGDKIRTVRCQAGSVICHQTGARVSLKTYVRGEWLPGLR